MYLSLGILNIKKIKKKIIHIETPTRYVFPPSLSIKFSNLAHLFIALIAFCTLSNHYYRNLPRSLIQFLSYIFEHQIFNQFPVNLSRMTNPWPHESICFVYKVCVWFVVQTFQKYIFLSFIVNNYCCVPHFPVHKLFIVILCSWSHFTNIH